MTVVELDVLAWRLFEESNDAIFLFDADRETIWQANPAAQRLSGLPWRELRGKRIDELFSGQRRGRMTELLTAVRETGLFHSQEDYFLLCEDAGPRAVNLSVSRVHTPTGALGLVVARDVSERKSAEQNLKRFNDELERQVTEKTLELCRANQSLEDRAGQRAAELEQKNNELTAFVHSVSHDLRAPLRAMEGMAQALAEDHAGQIDPDGRKYIAHIIDSTRHMDILIDDLLVYSRLGIDELRPQIVSLDDAIERAREQLQQQLVQRKADIRIESPMPLVRAHRTTLVQIVANLVSNAIKFVDSGTTPRVTLTSELKGEDRVRVWISDNGIGIAEKDRERIFSVLERLHAAETFPGTGIGLAIVARGCERIDGACGVESAVGRGSRFWFEIPLAETADQQQVS